MLVAITYMQADPLSISPRKYTTISISKEIKEELEEVLYSSGKKQNYDQLLKEMISLKKNADAKRD